jgi:uncharacterized glyoxalase superfamily protein PhnB
MAHVTGSAPVLLVADVVKSANYFCDCVGFTDPNFFREPPTFCILHRDEHHLMLAQVDDPSQIVPHWKIRDKTWNIYFWVDDAETLYAELQEKGAKIDFELYDAPYGCKEFGIQDLDGHDIAFGQVLR